MSSTTLTPRELEILSLKATGSSGKRIAHELGISPRTVRVHISNILAKLDVCNSIAAVVVAIRDGDIDPDMLEMLKRGCCER